MFPTHRVVLFVLVLWTHGLAWAQSDWPPCEAPHDGALQADPLDYVVVEPPDVKADTPVVVMVHGLGHDNNGFIPFARGFGLPYRLVLPNAPRTYKKGFSWYRVRCQGSVTDVLESTKRLLALFRRLKKRWPKAGKPHVVGFSQGGVMGMSLAARYPDKVAGVEVNASEPHAHGDLDKCVAGACMRVRIQSGPLSKVWSDYNTGILDLLYDSIDDDDCDIIF